MDKRLFIKLFVISLIPFHFKFYKKRNDYKIIKKKVGNEYWILSTKDLSY